MAGLSRETLKWLQGLRLSTSVRNPRRDFASGYLVGEILSRFFSDITTASLDSGIGLQARMSNWQLVSDILRKHDILTIGDDLVHDTIHCKPGAASALVEALHAALTGRR